MKNSCSHIALDDHRENTDVRLVFGKEYSLINKVKSFQFTLKFEAVER